MISTLIWTHTKLNKNDEILSNNKSHGTLKWVSICIPRLFWSWNDTDSVFRTDEYLAFSIVIRTDFDRLSLNEEVKRAKDVDVAKHAFINLRPNDLTCEINLYDTAAKESVILRVKFRLLCSDQSRGGQVSRFYRFLLILWGLFQSRISNLRRCSKISIDMCTK